jgi:hypothetical protein
MKGDYGDRQRQRDEARRRANRSERTFRARQDAGRTSMLRERANINRLTGEIESSTGASTSKSKQRADLYEEWDRTMKSARERIADCPGITQATRERWSNDIKDLLVFSPGVKEKLEALKAELTSCTPGTATSYALDNFLQAPRSQDFNFSLFSPKTARELRRQWEIENESEPEQPKDRVLKKAGLVLVDLEIDRLIRMYDMYQYL